MDKVAEVKRLELSLSKTTIELNAKSSHLEAVLQENRQVRRALLCHSCLCYTEYPI